MRNISRYTAVSAAALVGMCAFVFMMSAMPGGQSGGLSFRIARAIARFVILGFDGLSPDYQAAWLGHVHFAVRKLAHFSEYAILGALAVNLTADVSRQLTGEDDQKDAQRLRIFGIPCKVTTFSWVFCVLYAASDELHQLFVPGRVGAVGDVLIDSAGAFAGIVAFVAIVRLLRRRKITFERRG